MIGERTQTASDSVDEGSVVSSNPSAQTMLARGSTVNLVVSTGRAQVTVPPLEGLSQDDAEQALTDAGLKVGDVERVESAEHVKGQVVSSTPGQDAQVDSGSEVDLQVSNGKVMVPNVNGLTLVEATAALTQAGLAVDATEYRESTQPENTVIEQSDQGKTVDRGTKITLVLAKAPVTPTETPSDTPSATPSDTPSDTPSATP
ncbi:hypothetical protein GCM10025868_22880 [Angustibacter aerolatus]|uniref:PASTA domain-containing protein n=1 Tax=Angustibacter aerolatus TaxID=1162965 RepID=A0ABQ6JFT4_9ACTN|nr:PASTA domain-containing protein [Angustibacter aerolatus]GMA87038.1 hypothetical protein GCM10025868_22880 [Angustibacter aerolatus]